MIGEVLVRYADAITTAIAAQDRMTVPVQAFRPEAPAGPVIWVSFAGITWRAGAYRVSARATCLGADGLAPPMGEAWLAALADYAVMGARAIGAAEGVTATPATVTQGSGIWPTIEVVAPVPVSQCTEPTVLPEPEGIDLPWLHRLSSSLPTPA